MRDPGTPRRNPFFEHGSDGSTDFGMGWHDDADGSDAAEDPSPDPSAMPVGGFATLVSLVEALGDAQPEAAEHLVAAAHEIVLTVKVVVDATEVVLAQQRAVLAARGAMRDDAAATTEAAEAAEAADTSDDVAPVSVLHRTGSS